MTGAVAQLPEPALDDDMALDWPALAWLSDGPIEEVVVDLRREWCLTLGETCLLHQAAQGASDRMIAFRSGRSRGTVRRTWLSIGEKSGNKDPRRAVFEVWRRCMRIRDNKTW